MIFSGKGGRRGSAADQPRSGGRHAARRREREEFGVVDDESSTAPTTGPYDVADAPAGVDVLDLGSLRIPAVAGVEIRLQANADGQIQQVLLVSSAGSLELAALAAPRTESIWDEQLAEIRTRLSRDGATCSEVDGEYGVELRARVRTEQGPTDLRVIGVDGPRWLLRAVYSGLAAADPEQAGELAVCLQGVVVDRGDEAKPAGEALPLRLPREMAEQAELQRSAAKESAAADTSGGAASSGRKPARRRRG